jgi:hypothetical protein
MNCRAESRKRSGSTLSIREQVTLGEGYLKQSSIVRDCYLDLPTGAGLGVDDR